MNRRARVQNLNVAIWLPPHIMFIFATVTLIGGASSFIEMNAGIPVETYWFALFLVSLFVFSKLFRSPLNLSTRENAESTFSLHWVCLSLLCLSSALFLWKGIPLLSANPNIARVKFFEGGALLSKAFYALPLVIVIGIIKANAERGSVFRYYAIAAASQMVLAGNKAALINAVFALLLGFWCARRKIPLVLSVAAGVITVLVTLFLFSKVTNSAEAGQSAWDLLMKRAFVSNELGLRACVGNADAYGPAPALQAFQSFSDRLGGYSKGYPVSTGRYLATAIYKYGDFYAPVWELTVTGYCDSRLLGGLPGVLLYSVCMALAVALLANRMATASSTLSRGLLAFLFYQLLGLYTGGNFAAQLLGFFGQSWILLAAIIFSGRLLTNLKPGVRYARAR